MKMNKNEFKLRVVTMFKRLIDTYFAEDNIIDRMANGTLKILVETNTDKIDGFIKMFCDKDGNVDANTIMNTYANQIPESGRNFDIKDYVDSEFVKAILPNKSLIIKREDLLRVIDMSPSH